MAKGNLSETDKAALKAATHDAALALIDDLRHIRSIISKTQPDAGDIRRLSNQLRRLLVEGDLRTVASPRIGRIEIAAPDLNPIYRSNDKSPFLFMSADELYLFGANFGVISIEEGSTLRSLPGINFESRINLRLEAFENQRVLCFRGKWISRGAIIKYIANIAHGVHTTNPTEATYVLLRKIRHVCSVSLAPNPATGKLATTFNFNPEALDDGDLPVRVDPKRLDLPLMHLVGTAHYLVTANDVLTLEREIEISG